MAFETDGSKKEGVHAEEKAQKLQSLKVVIVKNTEAFQAIARDVADDKMTEAKKDLKGVTGFIKKVWKHNLAQDYYRQKEVAKAKKDMEARGSLYEEKGPDNAAHVAAMNTLIEQFSSEYEEAIHTDAGEKREIVEAGPVLTDIQNLIKDYANGTIADEAAFLEAKKAILAGVTEVDAEKVASGLYHADNLFEIAKSVKEGVAHGEVLDTLLGEIEVSVGVAKSGVRTEAQFNTVDRLVDKMQKKPILKWINEDTVAAAVAIAYAATVRLSESAARSKTLAWGTVGASALLSGGIAGLRESRRIEEERRQHARDMAKGKTFEKDTSPRREGMDKFRYNSISAADRVGELQKGINRAENENTKDTFKADLLALADTNAHIKLSDQKSIDLLVYSDESLVEEERLRLDITRAEARVRLKKIAETRPELLPDGVTLTTLDAHIQTLIGTRVNVLMRGTSKVEGIEKKDQLFKKMKRGKVARSVTIAMTTGLVIGDAAQEGMAFFRDDQQGFIEGLVGKKGGTHATALEGIREYFMGQDPSLTAPTMVGFTVQNGPQAIQLQLPAGATLQHMAAAPGAPRNTPFQLSYQGKTIPDLQFTDTGEFTPASIAKLHGSFPGLQISEISKDVISSATASGSAEEYVKQSGAFNSVHRKLWYDNNTPAIFDQNEIRPRLGGIHGTGIDTKGNFVYDVSSMTKGGSFHAGLSVDAQAALKAGNLGMNFSFKGQADKAFFIPFDANGKLVIDPNSQIGKLMFVKGPGGKMVFQGGFAEVVEVMDGSTNGAQNVRVLATQVGNNKGIGQQTTWVESVCKKQTASTLSFAHFAEAKEIDPPPFIPLLSRTPLERVQRGELPVKKAKEKEGEPVRDEILPVIPRVEIASLVGPGEFLRLGYEPKNFDQLLESDIPAEGLRKSEKYYTIASPALQRLLEGADKSDSEITQKEYRRTLEDTTLEIGRCLASEQYSAVALPAARLLLLRLRDLAPDRTLAEYQSHVRAIAAEAQALLEGKPSPLLLKNTAVGTAAPLESDEGSGALALIEDVYDYEGDGFVEGRGYRNVRPVEPSFFGAANSSKSSQISNHELSRTIKENSGAELNFYRESSAYFRSQESNYREQVRGMALSLGPLPESCKVSIGIPVNEREIHSSIYITLEKYLSQSASPEIFELILFVNRSDTDREGNPTEESNALDEIKRFQRNHPTLSVKVMESVLPRDQATPGYVRKLLSDAIFYRAFRRGLSLGSETDHIMVSNDENIGGISTGYVQGFLNDFDRYPEVDSFVGQTDLDPRVLAGDPLLHVRERLTQYMDIQMRRKKGDAINTISGSNMAFKGSIYAAVGGYPADSRAPDADLGKKIQLARMGGAYRRTSVAYQPAIAYAPAGVSRIYNSVVLNNEDRTVNFDDPAAVEKFKTDLEKVIRDVYDRLVKVDAPKNSTETQYDRQISADGARPKAESNESQERRAEAEKDQRLQMFRRSLGWLGVTGEEREDGKQYLNTENLISSLKEYQSEANAMRDRKVGRNTET